MAEPTINESIQDAQIAHAVGILRYRAGVSRRMLGLLEKAEKELRTRLNKRLEAISERGYDLGPATTKRLQTLLASISEVLKDTYGVLGDQLKSELFAAVNYEAAFQVGLLQREIGLPTLALSIPPASTLKSIVTRRPIGGRMFKDLIADATSGAVTRANTAIRLGIVQGETRPQIIARVLGNNGLGLSKRGVTALVQTAVTNAMAQARAETFKANSDIIAGERWVSTLDSKTSSTCFVGSTRVASVGEIRRVFRRAYDGEVLIVTTSGAKQIEVTPNHPILTSEGWRAASELRPGNEVVYSISGDGLCVTCRQHIGMPPTLADLFDAVVQVSTGEIRVERASAADFHGDGRRGDEEVHVATLDGRLVPGLDASGAQEFRNQVLGRPDMGVRSRLLGGKHPELLPNWHDSIYHSPKLAFSSEQLVNRALAAPDGGANRFGLRARIEKLEDLLDFLWSHGGGLTAPYAEVHGSGLHRRVDLLAAGNMTEQAGAFEVMSNGGGRDAVCPCQSCGALAVTVSSDDVVEVRSELRRTHVYNLETTSGVYLANGLAVHNCQALDGRVFALGKGIRPPAHIGCRSTTTPLLVGQTDILGDRASAVGPVPAKTTYSEWLLGQSVQVQNDVLGIERARLFRKSQLTLDRFVDETGRYYTLDELAAVPGIGS